jgi:hypothetical protein
MTKYTLEKRECWQIGNKLFLTQKSAAKRLAWIMLLEKYSKGGISNIKAIHGLVCTCGTQVSPQIYYGVTTQGMASSYTSSSITQVWTPKLSRLRDVGRGCPIHDRKTGYFHRVVEILARIIMTAHQEPDKRNARWFKKVRRVL